MPPPPAPPPDALFFTVQFKSIQIIMKGKITFGKGETHCSDGHGLRPLYKSTKIVESFSHRHHHHHHQHLYRNTQAGTQTTKIVVNEKKNCRRIPPLYVYYVRTCLYTPVK